MKLYYWNKKRNFGDLLGSYLIKRFTNLPTTWSPPESSELVMMGSILEHLPNYYTGVIAGIGKLHQNSTPPDLEYSTILALRGPLSAKGIKGNFVLADPGLLADELVPQEDKEYDLGLIPHWTDFTLEKLPLFKQYNPKIINVLDDPLKVISEIGKCKKIVSSSLHGIILADAFGIPRRIEVAPRLLTHPHQEGGLFKWHDYSASLNLKLTIGVTQEVDRNKVIEKQHELFDVFQEIKGIFAKDGFPL